MALAGRSEPSLNSMGEMLIFLQMKDNTQSPTVLTALTLHALCVGQSLGMTLKKHAQIWQHKAEIRKSKWHLSKGL